MIDLDEEIKCWEYKKCGHDQIGDCEAYPRGGRCCYLLNETPGNRGKYIFKINNCLACDFYTLLKQTNSSTGFPASEE